MTEWERKQAGQAPEEPAQTLPSGHLAPTKLKGRPAPEPTGWSPTAWSRDPKGDDQKK